MRWEKTATHTVNQNSDDVPLSEEEMELTLRVESHKMHKRLTRKPEYTFLDNLSNGRHGWLRLTPAYSARLVEERLAHYPINRRSSFYGILVPAERVLARFFREHGFEQVNILPIRKRNCKRELYEYEITGTYAGA